MHGGGGLILKYKSLLQLPSNHEADVDCFFRDDCTFVLDFIDYSGQLCCPNKCFGVQPFR